MILPLNLNRRHKVALFFTLALAGIAALNGAKMMQVVGILLLGLALAWAFGSDSRVVHWLFLSVGVFLACGTVGGTWYIHQYDTNLYARKLAAFEHRIPELAKEYPLHKDGPWAQYADPPGWRPVTPSMPIPEGATVAPQPKMSSPHVTWDEPPPGTLPADFFSWNDKARVAGLDLSKVPLDELPGAPPEPLWGLISEPFMGGVAVAVWQVVVFGVILFALGLGLILGIRAKPLPTQQHTMAGGPAFQDNS